MANEFIIKNGFHSKGDSQVTGSLDVSGSLITSELTASGLNYPNADGVDGQVLTTDGLGNISFGHGEKLYLQVRNDDSVTILAGTPVYSTGEIGGSERIKVRIASASNAATMPAIGITETELDTGGGKDGFAIINGVYNTNITPISGTPSLGDNVYVHANGGLTTVKPTGSNLIQNIGIVLKTNGTVIQGMKVSSIDRTNDIPNISPGYFWVGNSDSVATPTPTSSIDPFPYTGSAIISGSLTISGSLLNTGTVTLNNGTYTLTGTQQFVLIDPSGGDVTINMPDAATYPGREIKFKLTQAAGANTVTLQRQGADTIDGATTYTDLDIQYESISTVSDGSTGWFIF